MILTRILLLALGLSFAAALPARADTTLDAVKKRGLVLCGVNTGLAGFSVADSQGNWTGLDVDICRAVAAAVLGDAKKVKFVPLNTQQRFTALQSGEVDILSRNTTWTLSRDVSLGMNFTVATFYDGQGFLVPKSLNVKSAVELNGASVCVQAGTTTELNMADFARAKKIKLTPVVFQELAELKTAFFGGRCQAYTSDASQLASVRASDTPNADDFVILPEIISKEPLGPAVRRGDEEWFGIVKWTIYALILAEERYVAQKPSYDKDGFAMTQTVDGVMADTNPDTQKLVGATGEMGKLMGLPNDWAAQAIRQVGNYGEIYERNVGPKTPLRLARGLNALWSDGGLMYGMPIR